MCSVRFDFSLTNRIMRIIEGEGTKIVKQDFGMDCYMELAIRKSLYSNLTKKLSEFHTLVLKDVIKK